LAERINQLDDDRELLSRLGHCARQKVMIDFDERLVIQRTLNVYAELLHPRTTMIPAARSMP
jgi:glycosyltransferase involved in cell wall biosynthesis